MIKHKIIGSILIIASIAACSNGGNYGQTFDASKPIAIDQAIESFKVSGTANAIVSGSIAAVCQSEGCWFNYKTKTGDLFVDFDHKFEIPKTVSGKTAIANGHFAYDTTSVEQLKEYAKDDGKTQSYIDSIVNPEIRMIFYAEGVKIQ